MSVLLSLSEQIYSLLLLRLLLGLRLLDVERVIGNIPLLVAEVGLSEVLNERLARGDVVEISGNLNLSLRKGGGGVRHVFSFSRS